MTDPATEQDKSLVVGKPKEIRVVTDVGPLANLFDTARFEHMFRIAEAMAISPLIPEHLRGNKHGEFTLQQVKGNCFRIVNQALRWSIDPFAIVDETYVAAGKLAYQGKLVAAVINSKAGLKKRLAYSYSGTKGKDDYTITISGTFIGEDDPREVTLSVGEAKTANQMWVKDPEQKLVYSGVVRWGRRYTPELLLGVMTDDDVDRMDAWRTDAAKTANVKQTKNVERPDFGTQSELAGNLRYHAKEPEPEPTQPAEPPKRESKPKTAEKEKKGQESPQNRLWAALTQHEIKKDEFLEGLKLVYADIPKDIEVLHELSDQICEIILKRGLSQTMEEIRDVQWMKGGK